MCIYGLLDTHNLEFISPQARKNWTQLHYIILYLISVIGTIDTPQLLDVTLMFTAQSTISLQGIKIVRVSTII